MKYNKDFCGINKEGDGVKIGIATIAWDKICKPKCEGDSGIRRTEDVKAAILARHGWKSLDNQIIFGYN